VKSVPAVNDDRSLVSELFFSLVNLTDQFDKPLTAVGHALVWPVRELKLSHCATLTVLNTTYHIGAV